LFSTPMPAVIARRKIACSACNLCRGNGRENRGFRRRPLPRRSVARGRPLRRGSGARSGQRIVTAAHRDLPHLRSTSAQTPGTWQAAKCCPAANGARHHGP
jgi:hypothetical protein